MDVRDRIFFGAGILTVAASIALGGLWESRSHLTASGGPGAPILTDDSIQKSYSDALDTISANYAGQYAIEDLNKSAIQGMLRTLDPHSSYFDSREFAELRNEQQSQLIGIGVSINPRNGRMYVLAAVPGTPAAKAGLRYGDAIVAVDGKPTSEMGSREVLGSIRGELGQSVQITVDRVGVPEPVTFQIVREQMPLPSVRNYFMLNETVGYVGLTTGFSSTTDQELGRAISELKGEGMQQLVLDLRRNPGGLLDEAIKVAQRFLPGGQQILRVKAREGGSRDERVYSSKNESPESMPLVVLIDGGTASASEVVTGALQDHDRALVMGETSFGKGLVQTVFDLNFQTGLTLTTAKYYTPTGRSIQRDFSHLSFYDYYLHRTTDGTAGAQQGEALLTDLGRPVYGGGGITPDIKIPPQTTSHARGVLFGAAFEFSRNLVAGQFPELHEYKIEEADYNHRLRGDEYPISDKVLEAFRRFVAEHQKDFPITDAQITANLDYVRNQIREEVVTAAYGTEAGNQILILNDPVSRRAIEALPQARQLAENARSLSDRR